MVDKKPLKIGSGLTKFGNKKENIAVIVAPKCGSRSLEVALGDNPDWSKVNLPMEQIPPDNFYYIIRDPLERYVSGVCRISNSVNRVLHPGTIIDRTEHNKPAYWEEFINQLAWMVETYSFHNTHTTNWLVNVPSESKCVLLKDLNTFMATFGVEMVNINVTPPAITKAIRDAVLYGPDKDRILQYINPDLLAYAELKKNNVISF